MNDASQDPIKLPGNAVGDGQDLAAPISGLLRRMRLLPGEGVTPNDKDSQTPDSLQVIQAGSLAASRQWIKIVGGAGFGSAVAGITGFWNDETPVVRAAVVIGAAIVLAAAALGIAMILNGDVRGRAAATVAQYQARAQVSTNFVEGAVEVQPANLSKATTASENGTDALTLELLVALSSFPKKLRVTRKDGTSGMATGIRRDADEGVLVQIDSSDWVPAKLIRTYASQT